MSGLSKNGAIVSKKIAIAMVLLSMILTALTPLTISSGPTQENGIMASRTLDRPNEVVVVEGSQCPDYIGYNEANIFVWAYRGGWQQVVFQIDVANGLWPFDSVHKKYGDDDQPGVFDADDEICFMADELGDSVSAGWWAPGADDDKPRIEITAYDPLTGDTGWVYLFYHTTPPSWTTESYVAWDEGTNSLTADNYTMDYPDDDTHNCYFTDITVTPAGGGDNGQFIDRSKYYAQWFYIIFTNRICEQRWVSQWSGNDGDGLSSENSLSTGPVRIIRHWRMAYAPGAGTEWGEKQSFQVYYYRSHISWEEHGKFWGSTTHQDDRFSIDHLLTTPAASYWDGNGNSATIDGSTAGDSYTDTSPLNWYQVSGPHGSYVLSSDISFSTSPPVTSQFIEDSGSADNDGGRSGASAGKYGDIAMHRFDLPSGTTQWNANYNMYMLPSNAPDQGSQLDSKSNNPISTTDIPPVSQDKIGDPYPPATTIGSVLLDGSATLAIPKSTAGTVTLTATVDDTGQGGSNIASAVWTQGFANFPGTAMAASDGAFDEVSEGVTDTIDISGWSAGVYDFYVYGTDTLTNQNTSASTHATLTITDNVAPQTLAGTVLVDGSPTHNTFISTAGTVNITAGISDAGRGDSNIASANWTTGFAAWPGTAMTASDGGFDEVSEDVIDTVDLSGWDAGSYEIHVYGTDADGQENTTSMEHATISITDDVAPAVQNVLADGLPVYTIALSDAWNVTLTATLNDDLTGGSQITGANFTVGASNWPSTPMENATPLDSDIEDFSHVLDISDWLPGTYLIYVYGSDAVGNDNLAGAYATIIITNDASPEIENVLLDGQPLINVPFSVRGTVTLIGAVNDWGHGDQIIGGANYTVGVANWPGAAMSPVDVLNTPYENFTVDIDISNWPVGSYDFYIYGWDITNDGNSSSLLHATLVIYDDVEPVVENVTVEGLAIYETTFSTAGTVVLRGVVNDTGRGDTLIGGANYTVGQAKWPGMGMGAETALDSPSEAFDAVIDISSWLPGVYRLYVYGWDDVPNNNDWSPEYATVIIHDDLAPEIYDVRINGTSSFSIDSINATSIELTGVIDDATHGNSNIGGANYTLGLADWPSSAPMGPQDGVFDSPLETASATIDISDWYPGTYRFYVYGWDVTPTYNVTSVAYATLEITDAIEPIIQNFLVDGGTHVDGDLDTTVTFTTSVTDVGRGDSRIFGASFTSGYKVWSNIVNMTNDTVLDSPTESFTQPFDCDNWPAGNHSVFVYASDVMNNVNDTSMLNVTLNISDNKAPVTEDWSAELNGHYELWVDPAVTSVVWLNATVTDAMLGYSNIDNVNFTVGPQNWTDADMDSMDADLDWYMENVTSMIDISSWGTGTYHLYVYAMDSWGNGQTATNTYCILHIDGEGPEILGPWADGVRPVLYMDSGTFQLTAYGDDRDTGSSIVTAAEYFIDWTGANGTGIPMSPTGFRFDSPYEGAKANVDFSGWSNGEYHIYYVHFLDAQGHWGLFDEVTVMRRTDFAIPVHLGWNLISLPLIQGDCGILQALDDDGGATDWDVAMYYDNTEPALSAWKSFNKMAAPSVNQLISVDHTIALWIRITDVGDGYLDVFGAKPGTISITLEAGWNFVGYPTLNNTVTVDEALSGTGYTDIVGYDGGSPYLQSSLPGTYVMQPGEGYWIKVPATVAWLVDY